MSLHRVFNAVEERPLKMSLIKVRRLSHINGRMILKPSVPARPVKLCFSL